MKLKLQETKAFWLYIVGGAIAFILGGMLMPVWESFENELFFRAWGRFAVNIMISVILLAYIFLYLVKRIKRYSTTPAQIVAIVELVLMVVIAIVCTVSAFVDFISFGEPCQVFGLALWARGVSGVFTGYYCDSNMAALKKPKKGKKEKDEDEPSGKVDDFTVWRLVVAVFFISIGTYFFIEPLINALTMQWFFSCTITLSGAFFVVLGIALKPNKVKPAPKTEVKLEDTSKESELEGATETEKLEQAPSIKINLTAKEEEATADSTPQALPSTEESTEEPKTEKPKTGTPALVPTNKK